MSTIVAATTSHALLVESTLANQLAKSTNLLPLESHQIEIIQVFEV